MRDLLFLSVMLTLVPLSLRFPVVGAMGWAWTALLTPNDWLYSYMAGLPFNKIFAITTLVSLALNARQVHLRMNRTLWLMLLMALIGTVSALFSIDQSAESWDLYFKLLKIIVFPFVLTAVLRNRLDVHAVLLAIALGMGFVGVSEGAFYVASAGGHKIVGNASMGDNNQMAVALLVAVPIVLYLAAQSQLRWVRLIGYAAAALLITAIIGTYSRGALVGLVALAVYMIAASRRKVLGLIMVALVGTAVLVAAPATWFQRMDTIGDANDDHSFTGRVIAWKVSTMIALGRPLTGGGFHAVQHAFAWGLYSERVGVLDFIPTAAPGPFPRAAHSIYFETLGDLGFTGLFTFLALMGTAYLNCRAVRRRCAGNLGLRWANDLAFSLQSSLVVYAVAGAAVSVSYVDYLYIVVTLATVLRSIVERETVPVRAGVLALAPVRLAGAAGEPALAGRAGTRRLGSGPVGAPPRR